MQIYKSVIMSNILLLDSAIMEQILRSSTTFPGITRIHKQWISCLDPSISRNIQWTLLTRPVLSCNQQTFCSLWPVSEVYAMVRSCQSEGFINRTPFVNDLVPIVVPLHTSNHRWLGHSGLPDSHLRMPSSRMNSRRSGTQCIWLSCWPYHGLFWINTFPRSLARMFLIIIWISTNMLFPLFTMRTYIYVFVWIRQQQISK